VEQRHINLRGGIEEKRGSRNQRNLMEAEHYIEGRGVRDGERASGLQVGFSTSPVAGCHNQRVQLHCTPRNAQKLPKPTRAGSAGNAEKSSPSVPTKTSTPPPVLLQLSISCRFAFWACGGDRASQPANVENKQTFPHAIHCSEAACESKNSILFCGHASQQPRRYSRQPSTDIVIMTAPS
jgi:hypothetical protein